MQRRAFLKWTGTLTLFLSTLFSQLKGYFANAWAGVKKKILPRDHPLELLIDKNPADLDTTRLAITPLDQFQTMGITDHEVDLDKWRLVISGAVATPLALTYAELHRVPVIERNVLLICPGVFAYHARWKGADVEHLLRQAGVEAKATHLEFQGYDGDFSKTARFAIEDIRQGDVFLAYAVNGSRLPRKHGYPLRLVANGVYGHQWVKYVNKIEVMKLSGKG